MSFRKIVYGISLKTLNNLLLVYVPIYLGVRCPLNKIIYLVYSWATKRSLTAAIGDINVGKKMAINVYQWCRDICLWSLINGPDIKLGGPDQIVQIDESIFTHQGKVCAILIALYKICETQ